ncbi:AI-2E family transporter [Oceanobacillus halophilus]|uniref:AI-2E family transporter n=1 Tax=Oceanobacillus halophilus TaxID=930130 RepID=A0A495ADJ9_9BACI|nr:AI-2E family transporter [Oceanobacillus halophilus]RKQ37873.1 AI-2E family transporter [Oceanobacillus halophilus]
MFRDENRVSIIYWLLIGILLFLFVFLLVKTFPYYKEVFTFLWKLFLPFIIACLIAYLLFPIIEKLHSFNIHRGLAILLIYLLFFVGVGYLIYRVYPAIVHQVHDLSNNFPQFVQTYQKMIYSLYEYTSFMPETVHDKMDHFFITIENSLDDLLSNLLSGFTKIFDMIITITVIPVLVFYFLKDYEKIKGFIKTIIPSKYRKQSSKMVHAIDDSLGDYIRGQLIVCLFVSLTALLVFKFLKIEYALLLAIIMGVTNIIPYFGPIIGAVPAIIITFTTTNSIQIVIFVIIGIFVIQVIEGNLLSPYIVGKSVAIHPVAIIFALLLGGQLFGVIGMILAVPVLSVIKVMTNHALAISFRR